MACLPNLRIARFQELISTQRWNSIIIKINALFFYNYLISHFFNCVFNLPGGEDDAPEPVCRDDHDDHGGRVHGHGRGRLDNSAKTDG
jgi:hypothetical protein